MASDNCFTVFELTLSGNLDKLRNYFYNWRLNLNTTKTVCSAFHLTNRLADYEWNITTMGQSIPFDKTLKYLLPPTFTKHRSKSKQKMNLLKKLTSNHWGADFTTLHTSALALCFTVPIMESKPSNKKLDTSLNERLRLVSGCIKSTCTELLPILSGIEPMDIRRNKNIVSLRISAMENTHIFHQAAISPFKNGRLKSCHYQIVCTI